MANRIPNGWTRRLGKPATRVIWSWPAAFVLTLWFFKNDEDVSRHMAQVAVVWLPLLVVLFLPELIRYWKKALVALASTILAAGAVTLVGPTILQRVVMPMYYLDVDHWPRPGTYSLNSDGVFGPEPDTIRDDDFVIVFLGDSYTEGMTLSRDMAFPSVIEKRLRAEMPNARIVALNMGWASSSPLTQLRRFQAIGAKYKPDIVLQFFDMTDFHDDIQGLYQLREGGLDKPADMSIWEAILVRFSVSLGVARFDEWVRSNRPGWEPLVPETQIPVPTQRYFPLFEPLSATEPLLEPTWGFLSALAQASTNLGATSMLFVYPRYQHYDPSESPNDWEKGYFPTTPDFVEEPFKWFERKSASASFPIYSMLADFRGRADRTPLCQENDPHWNERGHEFVADIVIRELRARDLLPKTGSP